MNVVKNVYHRHIVAIHSILVIQIIRIKFAVQAILINIHYHILKMHIYKLMVLLHMNYIHVIMRKTTNQSNHTQTYIITVCMQNTETTNKSHGFFFSSTHN
ncbi:hypothetical protein BLA29_005887 [Euroglyphus maynei]|uniref:Uncharacterized protein n=1 Tax=Euroglyphus maynei TaxID=6958 RepID=A0A1Y3BPZ2_EURMA|nr:hypothetical protein BLA29_005887 [Euroglyphus maynei]